MPAQTEHDLQTVLDAIRGEGRWASPEPGKLSTSFGNVMAVAQRLGVHRTTVNRYMHKWVSVKEAIIGEREALKDFAESKIAKHIQNDNVPMTIFYAKTQMKDRGYIERQELTGADGGPVDHEIEIKESPLDKLRSRLDSYAAIEAERNDSGGIDE